MRDRQFTPPANPLEGLLGYDLRRVSASLMAALGERLARLDLKVAEASILAVIGANPGISQTDTGRALGIQRANMNPLATALIARGLIVRQNADGRSHALQLTKAGQTLCDRATREMQAHERDVFKQLSQSERQAIGAALRKLKAQD